MNERQRKILEHFLMESDDLFHAELKTDENFDYRRGYYAGRLHASLAIKASFEACNSDDIMRIKFDKE